MDLDVEHYLRIYELRKKMQDEGTTNPTERIKEFTQEFVDKLKHLPLKEKITLNEYGFYDSTGTLLIKIPID